MESVHPVESKVHITNVLSEIFRSIPAHVPTHSFDSDRKLFRPHSINISGSSSSTATLAICRKFCYLKHFVFVCPDPDSHLAYSSLSAAAVKVLHFISSPNVYAERGIFLPATWRWRRCASLFLLLFLFLFVRYAANEYQNLEFASKWNSNKILFAWHRHNIMENLKQISFFFLGGRDGDGGVNTYARTKLKTVVYRLDVFFPVATPFLASHRTPSPVPFCPNGFE